MSIDQAQLAFSEVLGSQPQPAACCGNSLLAVNDDLVCQQQSLVNVFFFGPPNAGDREWVLVDAGMPFSANSIRQSAERLFGRQSRPAAIVLTHGHFDHVGGLPDLAKAWDVPVYAHESELPYLVGRSSYPPPDPAVGGGAMSFLSRFYPRGPINLGHRVESLPADGSVPHMPGWRWIHTPGHTAGHVALFRDADRTLIAGDAFVTQRQESALGVLLRRPEVRRPPAYYTSDWSAARESVKTLADLRPEIAATGHGLPMRGEALRAGLDKLVDNWDRVALPRRGRYVHYPALANERGVFFIPAPVADPQLPLVAAFGFGAIVGMLLLTKRLSNRR